MTESFTEHRLRNQHWVGCHRSKADEDTRTCSPGNQRPWREPAGVCQYWEPWEQGEGADWGTRGNVPGEAWEKASFEAKVSPGKAVGEGNPWSEAGLPWRGCAGRVPRLLCGAELQNHWVNGNPGCRRVFTLARGLLWKVLMSQELYQGAYFINLTVYPFKIHSSVYHMQALDYPGIRSGRLF